MSETSGPGDRELVAYLDGELTADERAALDRALAGDTVLRRRLEALSTDALALGQAFDVLLDQAPVGRLEAMIGELERPSVVPKQPARQRPAWRWAAALAAGVVLFVGGVVVGNLVLPRAGGDAVEVASDAGEGGESWRQAVAEYLGLYTAETLAVAPDDPDTRRRELAMVGDRLGLDLTPDLIEVPALRYQRALLFAYDDRPLAQLAYLDPQSGPVSLCILADGAGPEPLEQEVRSGLNVVYWADAKFSYMLIGRAAADRLMPLAATLKSRIAT